MTAKFCQKQSSQYPIFLSQARDQSFTRVAKLGDEIREDIGRSRLCQKKSDNGKKKERKNKTKDAPPQDSVKVY